MYPCKRKTCPPNTKRLLPAACSLSMFTLLYPAGIETLTESCRRMPKVTGVWCLRLACLQRLHDTPVHATQSNGRARSQGGHVGALTSIGNQTLMCRSSSIVDPCFHSVRVHIGRTGLCFRQPITDGNTRRKSARSHRNNEISAPEQRVTVVIDGLKGRKHNKKKCAESAAAPKCKIAHGVTIH